MEEWLERPTGFPKVGGSNPRSEVFSSKKLSEASKRSHNLNGKGRLHPPTAYSVVAGLACKYGFLST